jgi:hypothetical protein
VNTDIFIELLISKMGTYLWDKMHQCNNNFFFVQFVTMVSLHFWNQRKNTDPLILILTYFMKKIFRPYLVDSESFAHQECNFPQKSTKNTGKRI